MATTHSSLSVTTAAIVSCERCPRLRAYCARISAEKKRAHRDDTYWGRPVPGFGDPQARILLVGLAPAAHGANRTGRPFTGDGSGGSSDFLMAALHRAGLANQATSAHKGDGLQLKGAYLSMAVRCAPPDNAPTPEELARCLDHLDEETGALPHTRVVVALGKIAFDAWLRLCRRRGVVPIQPQAFGHEQVVRFPSPHPVLLGSYHPSRQNTNTGRLTAAMLDAVLQTALLEARRRPRRAVSARS